MDSIAELLSQVQKGDRRSIAKAITLVESKKPQDRALADDLLNSLPEPSVNTLRIGISGPPGVGKSTFIEAIGQKIIEEKGLKQQSDPKAIEALIDKIINDNREKAIEYKQGKEKLFGFFVGQAMKASGGKANPQLINEILKKKLQ